MTTIKRNEYKKPLARDLSGLSASGQEPEGICIAGSAPVSYTCQNGPAPTQTDACQPFGLMPTVGGCTIGNSPAQTCGGGSFVAPVLCNPFGSLPTG